MEKEEKSSDSQNFELAGLPKDTDGLGEVEEGEGGALRVAPSHKKSKVKVSYFDFIPAEIALKIFSYLNTKETFRLSFVCRLFFEILQDDEFWGKQATSWHFHNKPDNPTNVLSHYGKEYQKHLQEGKRLRRQERRTKRAEALTRLTSRLKQFGEIYLGFESMETCFLAGFSLWTLFLALRADELILWSYHAVFLPIYLVFAHVLLGLLFTDALHCFLWYNGLTITWRVGSLLLLLAKRTRAMFRTKATIYLLWTLLFTCLVIEAHKLEDPSFEELGYVINTYIFYAFNIFLVLVYCFWFPSGKCCKSDKCWISLTSIGILAIYWVILFITAKSAGEVDFTWLDAFVPVWVLIGISLFTLFLLSGLFFSAGERGLVMGFCVPCFVFLVFIAVFIQFLSFNLEQEAEDLPAWPWVIVYIPLFCLEIIVIILFILVAPKLRM
eukprot:TRINITY_DN12235_c0_g1_i1.p1 TRINITY_DN12235_c0_g1~~TRINITY_DN12235_c0_g1_i1.p1  ORF type:complete len:440 (-),score=79.34 TRINITY_DN12235_c0_g1_i1:98-1417(-)